MYGLVKFVTCGREYCRNFNRLTGIVVDMVDSHSLTNRSARDLMAKQLTDQVESAARGDQMVKTISSSKLDDFATDLVSDKNEAWINLLATWLLVSQLEPASFKVNDYQSIKRRTMWECSALLLLYPNRSDRFVTVNDTNFTNTVNIQQALPHPDGRLICYALDCPPIGALTSLKPPRLYEIS